MLSSTTHTTQKGSIIRSLQSSDKGFTSFKTIVTYSLSAVGSVNPPTVPNELVTFLFQSAPGASLENIKGIRSLKV